MSVEGSLSILSIVKRGHTYQVRQASSNPRDMDRQPYTCTDEAHLRAFLEQLGMEPWYITQLGVELEKGGFTALAIILSDEQMQASFPLPVVACI